MGCIQSLIQCLTRSKPQPSDVVDVDHELSAPVRSALKDVEHLAIGPERLKLKKESQIGVGGYGEVMLATLDNSREVAVKQLRAVGTKGDHQRLAIRLARELKIWATLRHPNILEPLGYYLSGNYEIAQLISVYMVNGNISDYLDRNQPVDVATRLKFVQGITSGLQYMHKFDPPIAHGDLKPANVLISDELNAVICDFGVASFINEAGPSGLITTRAVKGSWRYMSPELLLEAADKHTLPSDIWAWACTTYKIFINIEPYSKARTNGAVIAEVLRKNPPGSTQVLLSRLPQDKVWPKMLSKVIEDCWNFDPSKRPSVTTLIGATKYPINQNSANPLSSRSESPVGITHTDSARQGSSKVAPIDQNYVNSPSSCPGAPVAGARGVTSANLPSIRNVADSGSNLGRTLTGDNTAGSSRRPNRNKTDKDVEDFAHQGSSNVASIDQNYANTLSSRPKAPVGVAHGGTSTNLLSVGNSAGSGHNSRPVLAGPAIPLSSQLETPVGVTQGGTSAHVQSIKNGADFGSNYGQGPSGDNSRHLNTSKTDKDGGYSAHQGSSNSASVDQNPTSSQSEAQAQPPTRPGKPTTTSGAPVDLNPTNPTSSKSEVQAQPPTRCGNQTTPGAPVDQDPTHPTSSQPEAPGAQALNMFRSEPPTRHGNPTPRTPVEPNPTRRGNPTPDAPVDSNPTNSTSSKPEFQAQPPTRRGDPTTLGAPVDQDPTHPTLSQPEAPGVKAPNTFRSETPIRRGNSLTPDAPVGQSPTRAHPASSQPEALGAQAPNTFRSEPPTRRGNFTPGAPVDQNPTHPTSSQPEAPGAQAQNAFRSEPPTRRGNPNTLGAPVGQNPTHSTSSQPEAPGNQGQNTFGSEPPTRRGNLTTPSAPVDQNFTHLISSRHEAPVSVTQENTPSNLQTLGINNGAESRSNSKPDPTGDIPASLCRYLDPNEKDKGRGDSARQRPTHGTPINQNFPNPPSSRFEASDGIDQGGASANLQSTKNGLDSGSKAEPAPTPARLPDQSNRDNDIGDFAHQGSRKGAPLDQNCAYPTSSEAEAPVSVTQENTSSNLQTLSINNGAEFGSNSYPGPKKKKGRGDSTCQGPTHGAPINQNSANLPPSLSEALIGITQGGSSANLQSAKNGLDSGSNSRLPPALARYLDQIEKDKDRGDSTLLYSEAPVGVTEWGTAIYADFGCNSARRLGVDISNGGLRYEDQPPMDKGKRSSIGQDGIPPGPSISHHGHERLGDRLWGTS